MLASYTQNFSAYLVRTSNVYTHVMYSK